MALEDFVTYTPDYTKFPCLTEEECRAFAEEVPDLFTGGEAQQRYRAELFAEYRSARGAPIRASERPSGRSDFVSDKARQVAEARSRYSHARHQVEGRQDRDVYWAVREMYDEPAEWDGRYTTRFALEMMRADERLLDSGE